MNEQHFFERIQGELELAEEKLTFDEQLTLLQDLQRAIAVRAQDLALRPSRSSHNG